MQKSAFNCVKLLQLLMNVILSSQLNSIILATEQKIQLFGKFREKFNYFGICFTYFGKYTLKVSYSGKCTQLIW